MSTITEQLTESFQRLGHNAKGARVAAGGRTGLREAAAPTKQEDPVGDFEGGDFPASDFAYVPDESKPDTWQLLLTVTPGGDFDPDSVRAAVLSIDPTSAAVPDVGIPEGDLPRVLATLRKAWKAAIPDQELPAILTQEAAAFRRLGVPFKGLRAAREGRR